MKENENDQLTTEKTTVGQKNQEIKTNRTELTKTPDPKNKKEENSDKEVDEREHQHDYKTPEGTEGNGNLKNEKENKDLQTPTEKNKVQGQRTENPDTREYKGL